MVLSEVELFYGKHNCRSVVCASNHILISDFYGGWGKEACCPPVRIFRGQLPTLVPQMVAPACLLCLAYWFSGIVFCSWQFVYGNRRLIVSVIESQSLSLESHFT